VPANLGDQGEQEELSGHAKLLLGVLALLAGVAVPARAVVAARAPGRRVSTILGRGPVVTMRLHGHFETATLSAEPPPIRRGLGGGAAAIARVRRRRSAGAAGARGGAMARRSAGGAVCVPVRPVVASL
jgi:hypothetical protein